MAQGQAGVEPQEADEVAESDVAPLPVGLALPRPECREQHLEPETALQQLVRLQTQACASQVWPNPVVPAS